jgi:hypothetical protein
MANGVLDNIQVWANLNESQKKPHDVGASGVRRHLVRGSAMSQTYQFQQFLASLPSFVMCSDDPTTYGVSRNTRLEATSRAYIAPNARNLIWAMVFDIDRPEASVAWQDTDRLFPRPNWITQNPKNTHAHLAYALAIPVSRSPASRDAPQRLLARIQHAMTGLLSADRGYSHCLTKTPNHSRWRTFYERPEPYTLDELKDYLSDDLPLRIARNDAVGIGRNVTLFDALRKWSYRNRIHYTDFETWQAVCITQAQLFNTNIAPLTVAECKSIGKSVAKWTWKHISTEAFSELQRQRQTLQVSKRQSKILDLHARICNL